MKKYIEQLPEEILKFIYTARDIAEESGVGAYLIGGFVRDLILGVKNLDLDIVVEGDGIKFAEFISQKLNAGLIRHRRFGTATVILKKHLKVFVKVPKTCIIGFGPPPSGAPST